METVICIYCAPIPVVNRVEVRWFEASSAGVFGTKTAEQPHQPMIKDLDTGVEYMGNWLFKHGGTKRAKRALEIDEHIKKELEVVRTLVGTVSRCRVVTVAWSEYDIQTHIDVEPDEARQG
jgi:hypothetical protein